MSHLVRRVRAPPAPPRAQGIDVVHWQHDDMFCLWFRDDQQTPLRAQALALVERVRDITLSPQVRVYLGDRTRFRLTVLDADTTFHDIAGRPGLGIHPLGADQWSPLNGDLTVHVFDDVPHHDSLYQRRARNSYW